MNWYKKAKNSLSVNITTECIGSHHGQIDLVMTASVNNDNVGTLEFSIFNDEPYVNMLKVNENYRRQGIATMLLKELQRKFPETEIHMGMSTQEGGKLLESIPSKFTPNQKYNTLLLEKSKLKAKIDELQLFFDTCNHKVQRKEITDKGEEFNIINDRLYDIEKEMQGLKPGKNILEI